MVNLRDHLPPHLHVFYAGHKAVVGIETIRLTHGFLPAAQLAEVLGWAARHQAELQAAWKDCQAQRVPASIAYP